VRKKTLVLLVLALILIGGLGALIWTHEMTHIEINSKHGAESEMHFLDSLSDDRFAYVVRTEPCKYYCEEMFLAHDLNEVFGYTVHTLYILFMAVIMVLYDAFAENKESEEK